MSISAKIFVPLFGGLTLSASAVAQPALRLSATTKDIGTVPTDTTTTFTVYAHNIGNEPLVVTRVVPTCDCTTARWAIQQIAPADSLPLHITFNPKGIAEGRFEKSVEIYSNDGTTRMHELTYTGVLQAAKRKKHN